MKLCSGFQVTTISTYVYKKKVATISDFIWEMIIEHNTIQRHPMQCNATQYNVLSLEISMQYNVVQGNAMQCNKMLYSTMEMMCINFLSL